MAKMKRYEKDVSTKLSIEEEYPFSYLYKPVDTKVVEKFIKEYEKQQPKIKTKEKE